MVQISIDRAKIIEFCRVNSIRRLSIFGSVLREDFGPNSDVDVLVEFEPGHATGLDFFSMEMELSEIPGHKVDLNTPGILSPYFRDQVLGEAEILYARADYGHSPLPYAGSCPRGYCPEYPTALPGRAC